MSDKNSLEGSHTDYWVMGWNHGMKQEHDRIIKLLEDYQQQALVSNIVYLGLERAIKIIKGEIK